MKQTMQQSRNTNNPSVNPWTNKAKVRGQGLLNSILNKYIHDQQQQIDNQRLVTKQQKQYLELAQKIQKKFQTHNKIDSNLVPLFEFKKRCAKIDQILQWIQKVQKRSCSKQQNSTIGNHQQQKQIKTSPIDSNFVYLPLHSGTVFHEILKDCQIKEKRKAIGQHKNLKLKQSITQINGIGDLGLLLKNNIL